ncbi:M24 family metallopeptidase [Sediminispirochaeta bajacaliforniensis]|uniref:M24 family metallopeptidase n=1 Tax=Sediminispirochaeta bajacaliforniensis TaxID=148 RepID=UPI00035D2634|nr:Xaa-Pro peptidase family protein [Sediminispirochaeta bajacaliforniensis]
MLERELRFSEEEYHRRLRKVKASMDRQGMEVLVVVDPANMNYLTGYDGWSFYVHQGLIIALDRDEPFWFGRAQDSNGARLTTWLSEESILGYPDHYVQSRYTHTMRYVADKIAEEGWDRRRIGVEMDNYWFSARMYRELTEQLPSARFADATSLVAWVKSVKSDVEVTMIRQAAKITEKAMDLAVKMIEPGVAEREVAAAVSAAQIAGVDGYGGDSPAIFPIIPSGQRTSTAHLTFHPERSYQSGDVVLLELGSARCHYHAPLSRTVYLGKVPDDLKKVADVVVAGLSKTLEFIVPGVTAEEVEAYWRSCLAGTGVEKPSRVGYSFGLAYVPDWGEHTVSLRPGDKSVLEPGMTIHFMPGIWLDTYGFECSEPFLVTDSGCEKLVNFPERLFTKEG